MSDGQRTRRITEREYIFMLGRLKKEREFDEYMKMSELERQQFLQKLSLEPDREKWKCQLPYQISLN